MESTLEQRLIEEFKSHPRTRMREAWGEFVGRWPWEWFVNFTFTEDTHEERALKLFKVWKNKVNKHIYGPRWNKREPFGTYWVIASEFQKAGRIHFHGLMSGVGQTRRLDMMDVWFNLDALAGFPRISPVDCQQAVANYVTKYVTKGGQIEFSPNLRDISRDLVALAGGSGNSPAA